MDSDKLLVQFRMASRCVGRRQDGIEAYIRSFGLTMPEEYDHPESDEAGTLGHAVSPFSDKMSKVPTPPVTVRRVRIDATAADFIGVASVARWKCGRNL